MFSTYTNKSYLSKQSIKLLFSAKESSYVSSTKVTKTADIILGQKSKYSKRPLGH